MLERASEIEKVRLTKKIVPTTNVPSFSIHLNGDGMMRQSNECSSKKKLYHLLMILSVVLAFSLLGLGGYLWENSFAGSTGLWLGFAGTGLLTLAAILGQTAREFDVARADLHKKPILAAANNISAVSSNETALGDEITESDQKQSSRGGTLQEAVLQM